MNEMKWILAFLFAGAASVLAAVETGVTINGVDVGEGSGEDWISDGSTVTLYGYNTFFVLRGKSEAVRFKVSRRSYVMVTLDGLDLASHGGSPFALDQQATANLYLAGTNRLAALDEGFAGIQMDWGCRLRFLGAGGEPDVACALRVEGASGAPGIGSSVGTTVMDSSEVIFAGGMVTAVGGANAPGIGDVTRGTTFWRLWVADGYAKAVGSGSMPGIGNSDPARALEAEVTGGTIVAQGESTLAPSGIATHPNGVMVSGGSMILPNGERRESVVSGRGTALYAVEIPCTSPGPVAVKGLAGYATNGIYPEAGRICLWLPAGRSLFMVEDRWCAAQVSESGVTVDCYDRLHLRAKSGAGDVAPFSRASEAVAWLNEQGGGRLEAMEDLAFDEFPIRVTKPLRFVGNRHSVTGAVSAASALIEMQEAGAGTVEIADLDFAGDAVALSAPFVRTAGGLEVGFVGCTFAGFDLTSRSAFSLIDAVGGIRFENCRFANNSVDGALVRYSADQGAASAFLLKGTAVTNNVCPLVMELDGAGNAGARMEVAGCAVAGNEVTGLLRVRGGEVLLADGVGTDAVVLESGGAVVAGEDLLQQEGAMLYLDVRGVSERVGERIVRPASESLTVDPAKVRICSAGYAAFADGAGGVVVDTVTSRPFAVQEGENGWSTYATFDEAKLKAGSKPVLAVRYENRVRGTVFDTITNDVTVFRGEEVTLYSVLRYTEDGTNTCWSYDAVPAVRLAGVTRVEGFLDATGVDVGSSLVIDGGTVRLDRSVYLPFTNELHVVTFANPDSEADAGRLAVVFSNRADPLPFKRCMRVANPGWTFEPVSEADGYTGLRLVRVADYVAWVGNELDVGLHTDLREAFSALAATGGDLRLVALTNVTTATGSDRVELPLGCRVGGGAGGVTVTLGSAFRRTEDVTYDWDANPARPTTLVCNGTPIEIAGGAVLKPGNVALEGALALTGDGWLDLADYAGSPIAVKPLRNGVIATNAFEGALKLANGVDGILRMRENGTYAYHAPFAFEIRQVGNGLVELTVVSGAEREVVRMPENHTGVGGYTFADATTGWSTNLEWGVVWYDGRTGLFTLPPPDRFPVECVMQDGSLRPLADGRLPRDLLLTAAGGITLKCNGVEFVLNDIAAVAADVAASVAAVVRALELAGADAISVARVRADSEAFFRTCVTKFSLARAQDLAVNGILLAEMPLMYDGAYYAQPDAASLFDFSAAANAVTAPTNVRPVRVLQDMSIPAYACTTGVLEIVGTSAALSFEQALFTPVGGHPEVVVNASASTGLAELTNAVDSGAWQIWLQNTGVARRFEEIVVATNGLICADGPLVVGTGAQVRIAEMSVTGRKFGAERAAHVFEVRPHGALVLRDTEISGFALPEKTLGAVWAQDFGNVWFAGATRIDGNMSGEALANVYLSSPLAHIGLPEAYEPFAGFAGVTLRDEFSWTPAFGRDDYNRGVEAWQGFRLDLDRETVAPSVRDGVAIFVVAKTGVFVDGTDVAGGSGADRGWTYADGWLEFSGAGPYVLSGTNDNGLVIVRVNGDSRIVVSNFVLSVPQGTFFDTMRVESGASELTLVGANRLTSDQCALRVLAGASLKIDAADLEQTLVASSGDYCAGIGSGDTEAFGVVEIAGGSVTAAGGKFAAGIGAGCDGMGGDVRISGGFVLAGGGEAATGIGLGAYAFDDYEVTVEICGGTVLANGGEGAYYDIGTTADTFGYPVRTGIDGGSVIPLTGRLSPAPVNARGEVLRCVRVRLPDEWREVATLTMAGLCDYGTKDLVAVDGMLLLWLPDGAYAFRLRNGALARDYVAEVKGADVDAEFGSGVIVEPPEFEPPGEPLNIRIVSVEGALNALVTAKPVNGNRGAWYYLVDAERVEGPYGYVPGTARQAVTNGPIALETRQPIGDRPQRFYRVGVSAVEP